MNKPRSVQIWMLLLAIPGLLAAPSINGLENRLTNPGFEEQIEDGSWMPRFNQSASRRVYRSSEHKLTNDWSLVIEVKDDSNNFTSVIQGEPGRRFAVDEGDIVELTGWVKTEFNDPEVGAAGLRIYYFDENGRGISERRAPRLSGITDWTRQRVGSVAPSGAASCSPYLTVYGGGTGKAYFDDLKFTIDRALKYEQQNFPPPIAVYTDLPADSTEVRNLKLLLGDGMIELDETNPAEILAASQGALVISRGKLPPTVIRALRDFAREGNKVFMEIRNFAEFTDRPVIRTEVAEGHRIIQTSLTTSGFARGDVFQRMDSENMLYLIPETAGAGLQPLAVVEGKGISLVKQALGDGFLYGVDMLSLREPNARGPYEREGSLNKFLFMTNTLTNPVSYGEWYPRKFTYREFIEEMRRIADQYEGVILIDEGPASGREEYRRYALDREEPGSGAPYRLYSFNLGTDDQEAPLYFFYGAAHGWENDPSYGFLTFTRLLMEGEFADLIDLDRVAIKIIPILNPWGYDNRRRQNANNVDLNRQGDDHWEEFGSNIEGYDNTHSRWKGNAPFSEPETRAYKRIVDENADRLHFVLDFHGNKEAANNPLCIIRSTSRPDNQRRAVLWTEILNDHIRGRYILRQAGQEEASLYLMRPPRMTRNRPDILATSARDRYGFVLELTAGYGTGVATILNTDIVCEIIKAIFQAYPPDARE